MIPPRLGSCSSVACWNGYGARYYLIPTASEVPSITTVHLDAESPCTVGGFRGMGEGGTIGARRRPLPTRLPMRSLRWVPATPRAPVSPHREMSNRGLGIIAVDLKLKGRVALVTHGANGAGREIAPEWISRMSWPYCDDNSIVNGCRTEDVWPDE